MIHIMHITVKTLTGKELSFDFDPKITVAEIKENIEEKEGIPPAQQRIIFSGKQMTDTKNIEDHSVKENDTLHLILALRGGI